MTGNKFELVVVWDTGDRDVFEFESQEKAEQACENMKTALGNQITWCGIRPQL